MLNVTSICMTTPPNIVYAVNLGSIEKAKPNVVSYNDGPIFMMQRSYSIHRCTVLDSFCEWGWWSTPFMIYRRYWCIANRCVYFIRFAMQQSNRIISQTHHNVRNHPCSTVIKFFNFWFVCQRTWCVIDLETTISSSYCHITRCASEGMQTLNLMPQSHEP